MNGLLLVFTAQDMMHMVVPSVIAGVFTLIGIRYQHKLSQKQAAPAAPVASQAEPQPEVEQRPARKKHFLRSTVRGLIFVALPFIYVGYLEQILGITNSTNDDSQALLISIICTASFIFLFFKTRASSVILEKLFYLIALFFWGFIAFLLITNG